MRSNYKHIGKYVQQVNVRNKDLSVSNLQGININKEFMPSVANTTGTDLSKYKVVSCKQFAFNPMHVGRDEVLPISMLDMEEGVIVSPAYVVFEVKDTNELLPEYLMMWCGRSEFDRNAWFTTDSSVRGGFSWADFCDMELPVPAIEKQREIVKEYHTIVDRIKLNEQINQKLEETAQAIYKQWFVDFEFPISAEYAAAIGRPELERKPYKSSGGEMVFNEELDQEIPKGWEVGGIDYFADLIDGDRGKNYPSQDDFKTEGYCLFLNTGNVTKNGFNFSSNSFISKEKNEILRKGKLERNDIVLTTRGTVGNSAFFSEIIEYENMRINSGMIILRSKNSYGSLFVYLLLKSSLMKKVIENFLSGSAQSHLPIKDIKRIFVLVPERELVPLAMNYAAPLQKRLDLNNKHNRGLFKFRDVLLSKMTKMVA